MLKAYCRLLTLTLVWLGSSFPSGAQTTGAESSAQNKFPYSFSNFVWWSDTDLRAELRRRIPSLGDEITRNSLAESKINTVLTELLQRKGINARVQSIEPSLDVLTLQRTPDAPPPSIVFRVLAPPNILIDKVVFENSPSDATELLSETVSNMKGRPFTANLWADKLRIKQSLEQLGYLSASLTLGHGQPTQQGDNYLVPVNAAITSGPKYHVLSVKADGGPLLKGRDLSTYFSLKPGDVATPNAFGRLAGSLRALYWHAGYPDVAFTGEPVLDHASALATYQFEVDPGPIYHLRSLKIENLDPSQQIEVKNTLSLKAGDVYDALAVANLQSKLSDAGSTLKGYGVSYSPQEDKQEHVVDLTLNFYKQ
jgi:outer membrane protein assembly factor BamA